MDAQQHANLHALIRFLCPLWAWRYERLWAVWFAFWVVLACATPALVLGLF